VICSVSSEVDLEECSFSGKRYFWKVRIWDENDRPTRFSEIQSFITGNPDGYTTTENKFLSSLIQPSTITRLNEGHYFIDFGKDAFGKLILNINPDNTDTLIIHLGEKLSGENQIDRNPWVQYATLYLNCLLNPELKIISQNALR
jgi:hypothetical protein